MPPGLNPPPTTPANNVNWRLWARSIEPFLAAGFVWRGIFDPLVEYRVDNIVQHLGSLYIAVSGPMTGAVPGVDPRWEEMVAGGGGSGSDPSRARWGGWR